MHGRLGLTYSTADMATESLLQHSDATFTSVPNRQPTKNPLTLATLFDAELIAGAHSFFGYGALQVAPRPWLYPDNEVAC